MPCERIERGKVRHARLRRGFDDRDLVVRQPIQLVDEVVDLPVRRLDLALDVCSIMCNSCSTQTAIEEIRKSTTPGPTIADKQLDLTNTALKQISELYSKPRRLSVSGLASMADNFDNQDWKIIKTAPFLTWYLANYYDVEEPEKKVVNYDDVPF